MSSLNTLTKGDVVDVIAPASACSPEELERGIDVLRGWGLEPRVPDDLFGPAYIYANEDAVRWKQLRSALTNRTSRAIWCVRGGYGCARLLPRLSRLAPRVAKSFIGFSDLTALHVYFNQVWRQPTWHGPVLTQLGSGRIGPAPLDEFRECLFAERTSLRRTGMRPMNAAARRSGVISGRVLGGNLKTLQSLIGTPFGLIARGAILVLEDVDERGYAIDRMLVQLAQSGSLRGVRAVILGTFTGGLESNGRFTGDEVFERFAGSIAVPVLSGLALGHGPETGVLPLGLTGEVKLGKRPSLHVEWRALR